MCKLLKHNFFCVDDKLKITVDSYGYLVNINDWNNRVAEEIARQEKILLTEAHWDIILCIRSFYIEFNISPTLRMLIKVLSLKHNEKEYDSNSLFYLFPKGPAKQAVRIAGLPKSAKCL